MLFSPFSVPSVRWSWVGSRGSGVGGGGGAGQDKKCFCWSILPRRGPSQIFFVSFDAMCQLTHTEPKLMPCARWPSLQVRPLRLQVRDCDFHYDVRKVHSDESILCIILSVTGMGSTQLASIRNHNNGKIFTWLNPGVQCLLASLNVWLLVMLSQRHRQIPLRCLDVFVGKPRRLDMRVEKGTRTGFEGSSTWET